MEFGVVGRCTDGFFRYQGWPTVTKDEKGVIYAASSGHRLGHVCPFGKNLLYVSHDEGKTWSGPTIANDTYFDDRDAGLHAWGDGQLLLTWFCNDRKLYNTRKDTAPGLQHPLSRVVLDIWNAMSEEEFKQGSFIRFSQDGGKTWGPAIQVPVSSPHGPIRRKDGSFFYLGRESHWIHPEEVQKYNIYAYESRDEGKTWQQLTRVEFPEGFDTSEVFEPYAIELADGTILGAVRISSSKLPHKNSIATTFSYDGGKTFTQPQLLDVQGTPPHFLLHSSGAVILTYGRRLAPFGQRARISWDGGKTWGEEIVIGPEAPDWDLGYPSSVELSDGKILTVFYQKYPGDDYPSVLSTTWTLPQP